MYYQAEHQQMSNARCGTWGLEGLSPPLWPSFRFTEDSKGSNSSVWEDLWNWEEMFLMPLLLNIWWCISEFYQTISFPFHSASLMELSSHISTVYTQLMPNCFKLSHSRYPCGKDSENFSYFTSTLLFFLLAGLEIQPTQNNYRQSVSISPGNRDKM